MTALSLGSVTERAKASPRGVAVSIVQPGSPASRAGLKPGDIITEVEGQPIHDFLDFYIAAFDRTYKLEVKRGDRYLTMSLRRKHMEDTGLEIDIGRPVTCTNRCVFCFVDQLPAGLRKELYVKDEDYRLSFLHGNYLTLTNLSEQDESRIMDLHLSPLYASVHATDDEVRAHLLGGKPGQPILSILDRLGGKGIRFHTQVVVVPGSNDGPILDRTLKDLMDRSGYVLSVSVVPVGLTAHRTGLPALRSVASDVARRIVDLIATLNEENRQEMGTGVVYASDELLLVAGRDIPPATYYDDYPQIENGVGLMRRFIDSAADLEVPERLRGRTLAFVTGTLAGPYVAVVGTRLERESVSVVVVQVENVLLGSTVTVSGLLAGSDIMSALSETSARKTFEAVVLPPNVVSQSGVTLDEMTAADMAEALGVPVIVGDYDMTRTLGELDALFI